MGNGPSPFSSNRLLVFRPWVPRQLRFWLVVMFAFFYQLTGGVYLAALSQMVGELSFLSEDVTMAGYCSLIGLNMIFPVLFRWKFYFFSRQMWFVSSIGSIICALLAPMATVPWVLWAICLLAGYFKMMGMFGCMTTIQLNITPTRNYGVFFPVVYILVCGAIQVSGLMTAYIAFAWNWRYVYLVIVGLMLVIDLIVCFMMNHDHRGAPFVPLKGVDCTCHLRWTATCCVATWIFNFGGHYDFVSSYFLIAPATEAWRFYLPLVAFGAAEVMIESGATYMICTRIPFQYCFMNVAIAGFVRCGVGTSGASAALERLFSWSMEKNLDLMIAVKETFGYLVFLGIGIMLVILLSRYTPSPSYILPRMGAAARWFRHPHSSPDPTLAGRSSSAREE